MPRNLTLRQAVSDAAKESGLTQDDLTQVIGSRDQDVVQMAALLSAVADELMDEEPYNQLLGDGNWLRHANGDLDSRPTSDSDIILFDGRLAIMGLKYRFKKEKGFEYGEDMRDFLSRISKLAHRQNATVIDVDEDAGRVI